MRIAIVEDDATIGRLLKSGLKKEGLDAALYATAEEALESIQEKALPDIMLLDINLPGISGIELAALLKNKYPSIELLMQTVMEDNDTILRAIKAGASGYVLKGCSTKELLEAIAVIQGGGSFLTGKVARKVLQEFQAPLKGPGANGLGEAFRLSPKEESVLSSLIKGETYKEIAEKCGISYHTVNNHIRKIYEKMQVNSRGEAVAKAMREPAQAPSLAKVRT